MISEFQASLKHRETLSQPPMYKKKRNPNEVWWQMPVISATQEVKAGRSLIPV